MKYAIVKAKYFNERCEILWIIFILLQEENLESLKRHCQNIFTVTLVVVNRTSVNSCLVFDMLY